MRPSLRNFAVAMGVAVLLFAVPSPVHAVGLFSDFANSYLGIINNALGGFVTLLTGFIEKAGNLMQIVIGWDGNYGGAAVYQVWALLRDLTSMLFIAILIGISFATIFGTVVPSLSRYSFRSALVPLIIAGLFINMSLPLGQLIVWGGNELTSLARGLLPSDTNARIAVALNVDKLITERDIVPLTGPSSAALNTFSEGHQNQVRQWLTGAQRGAVAPKYALVELNSCIERDPSNVAGCFQHATEVFIVANNNATTTPPEGSGIIEKGWVTVVALWSGRVVSNTPAGSASDQVAMIAGNLGRIFLMLVFLLSIVSILFFLVIRIPAIWFLLAISSAAFFSIAIPGNNSFMKWLKNIVGWSIFAPLYLFVVYIGLFFLSSQQALVSAVANPQDASLWSSLVGTALFYIIAAFIFVGGAAWVFKFCFSLSPESGALFGRIGGALGISPETGFGINTVAQGLGRIGGSYGATAQYEAGRERLKQLGGDIAAGARGRYPRVFGTQEEALEKARGRFGVRGAEAGVAKIARGRIEEERQILETRQKAKIQQLENARAQARTDKERARFDGQIKKTKEQNEAELQRNLSSGNRDIRLAAGELLMNKGKLGPQELQNLGDQYRGIGREALAGFIERRDKQLIKDAKERKYTKGSEAKEMESFLSLFADQKQAGKYIDEAKKGNNKVWALDAGTRLKVIMGPDGKTASTFEEEVDKAAPKFTPADWANYQAHEMQAGNKGILDNTEVLQKLGSVQERLGQLSDVQKQYIRSLNDVRQRADMRKEVSKAPEESARMERDAEFAQKLKVELQTTLGEQTRKLRSASGTEAKNIQKNVNDMKEQLRSISGKIEKEKTPPKIPEIQKPIGGGPEKDGRNKESK